MNLKLENIDGKRKRSKLTTLLENLKKNGLHPQISFFILPLKNNVRYG